ncbi:MAG: undecaprenyl-phosphate glucose phosphotransferase [Chloroflexi bacterium]|nr:undecaprenyl-phosphate glucose phosphotransferase [Chloroflexota bacterium]
MTTQKLRNIYSITLLLLDIVLIFLAFALAYQLRVSVEWPDPLVHVYPLSSYMGLILLQAAAIVITLFLNKQYYIPRAASRVDQVYYIFTAVSIGTLIAVALSTFLFKSNEVILDYPRAMIVYSWLFAMILLLLGRTVHQVVRYKLHDRGWGQDRLLIVGSGEMAQIVVQRIQWSPYLGYDLVGVVNGSELVSNVHGVPVMGMPEDLPHLIEEHNIDEVIIALPEKGHREMVRIVSYCERGRVTIKIVPDVFQFMTSEAGIDALGGLPLLSVRDYALRGYMLIFKRIIDFLGALIGLIILSPLMLLLAIVIKLESPGPVFFIQQRMGLDGKPFRMIKFRSMRSDAERHGPGWTTEDDPRQTRLGSFLRKIDVDELPQLINVFLGEMSLVGPRPEQAHYVEQFRRTVPRYMERHQEKGGMTGWAQVNGLRGDTSIAERTKYDLWYSTNWSIFLDTKILLRTVWQIAERKNTDERGTEERPSENLPTPLEKSEPTAAAAQPTLTRD